MVTSYLQTQQKLEIFSRSDEVTVPEWENISASKYCSLQTKLHVPSFPVSFNYTASESCKFAPLLSSCGSPEETMASEESRIVQQLWITLQTHILTNSTVSAGWGHKNENRLWLNSLLWKRKFSVSLFLLSVNSHCWKGWCNHFAQDILS